MQNKDVKMYDPNKYFSHAYWRKVAPQILIAFAILGAFNLINWLFS